MKLLTKSSVQAEKARQTRAQIDEGVRIASKIDVLRQTLSQLEAQHEKFITGIRAEQAQATKDLEEQIMRMKNHIAELQATRDELMKPLDERWKIVHMKEEEVDQVLTENVLLQEDLLREKEKQVITTKKAKEALNKIKVNERELTKVLNRADEAKEEAEGVLAKIQHEKDTQEKKFKERETQLDEREQANDRQEVALKNQRALQDERELELNAKETEINDKYQTLLRTINRTKHG